MSVILCTTIKISTYFHHRSVISERYSLMKAAVLCALLLSVATHTYANNNILSEIKDRGYIRCGVNNSLLGFATKDGQGNWNGFDVEFCRALSVAVFNSPDNIRYVPVTAKERFSALKYNQIDVLYRNSTMTATRDISLGIQFAGVNYYDGQGFMVHKDKTVSSAYKIQDTTFCMTDGTSNLQNLRDFIEVNNLQDRIKILKLKSPQEMVENLNSGNCNATSSDQSQLYSLRTSLRNSKDYLILPEIISKEPLGPAVRRGDNNWFSVVRWTLNAMIEAEFLGLDSKNITAIKDSGSASGAAARLIGSKGNIGQSLGLESNWAYNVISKIGNYGEVFERTIGSQSELGIARGLNAQWNDGGILYSSPF